jgi:hypothetical protein
MIVLFANMLMRVPRWSASKRVAVAELRGCKETVVWQLELHQLSPKSTIKTTAPEILR